MTAEHDLDEILRRAMHAAVDSVEPSGDGLQRIRSELARPRLRLQADLLLAETADLIRLIGIRLAPAASWVLGRLRRAWAAVLAAVRRAWAAVLAAVRQPVPGPAAGRPRHGAAHRSQPPGRLAGAIVWLRPAIAVAAAVVIVVAGVFTLVTLQQTVSPISLLTGGGQTPAVGTPPGPGPAHSSAPGIAPASPSSTHHRKARHTRHRASPTPTCIPSTPAGPTVVSPSPTISPSPTDSPTVAPSPAGTAAASPAGAGTVAPASPPPAAGSGAGGSTVQLTSGCYGSGKPSADTPKATASP